MYDQFMKRKPLPPTEIERAWSEEHKTTTTTTSPPVEKRNRKMENWRRTLRSAQPK